MHRATTVHRTVVACPVCRLDDYVIVRRSPTTTDGEVEKRCSCNRCGAAFAYVEDRLGRPMDEAPAVRRARGSRRASVTRG